MAVMSKLDKSQKTKEKKLKFVALIEGSMVGTKNQNGRDNGRNQLEHVYVQFSMIFQSSAVFSVQSTLKNGKNLAKNEEKLCPEIYR